jgi:hypothetical protein
MYIYSRITYFKSDLGSSSQNLSGVHCDTKMISSGILPATVCRPRPLFRLAESLSEPPFAAAR